LSEYTCHAFYLTVKYRVKRPMMAVNGTKHVAVSKRRKVVVVGGAVNNLI
jgi:hypothetical protein